MSKMLDSELDEPNFLWPPKMRVTARRKHEYGTYGYVRACFWLFGTAQEAQNIRRQHQHPAPRRFSNNATQIMPFDANNKQQLLLY